MSLIRSDYPITGAGGVKGTLKDVISDDAARLLDGVELEFVSCGLSRYAETGEPWRDRFGEEHSFDSVAELLLSRAPGVGACGGLHVYHALAVLIRVDEVKPLLKPITRTRVMARLAGVSEALQNAQEENGSWGWTWAERAGLGPSPAIPDNYDLDHIPTLVATGHNLEWIAIAPKRYRPTEQTIRKAAGYLVRNWDAYTTALSRDWRLYPPMTHAARAVLLLAKGGNYQISKFAACNTSLNKFDNSLNTSRGRESNVQWRQRFTRKSFGADFSS